MSQDLDGDGSQLLLLSAAVDDPVDADSGADESTKSARAGINRIDSAASAMVRTLVSSLSFMFQRPIRLFRPVQCT